MRAEGKIRNPSRILIDEPTLKPMAHIFVESKAPWYEILDGLPRYDESRWAGRVHSSRPARVTLT